MQDQKKLKQLRRKVKTLLYDCDFVKVQNGFNADIAKGGLMEYQ
jgi:hypothetical protein